MGIITNIEPKPVMKFFEKIASIPHGSSNTKELSDYILSFAKNKGLECYQDKINNVIVIKEATAGYENAEALIMQAHIDMVCEKNLDNSIDMSKEAIKLVLNGDILSADGTTLGADDGIGAAYILAVLDDDTLCHPKIEAVFTVDEEIGLLGAFEVDFSKLTGKKMLNLDGGCEKIFTVSCAGGATLKAKLPVNRVEYEGTPLKITVSGLAGGHSGVMIGNGGANSNVLSGRILAELSKATDFRLSAISGGFKDNAIPVSTTIEIVTDDAQKCISTVSELFDDFKLEYDVTDPDLCVTVEEGNYAIPFDKSSTQKIMYLLSIAPNGVQKMSSHIDNLVETSLNFAILNSFENHIEAVFSVRSSVNSQKDMLITKIKNLVECIGGTYTIYGDYPGWEFKKDSELRELCKSIYTETHGTEPIIEAVHAGLECGLFSGMIKDLDAICYGPDMWDIHTPSERLSVSSTGRVWEFIKELLKRLK